MSTRRTTLLLDADLLDRLDRLATRQRTTKTALVGAALEAFLADQDAQPPLAFLAIGQSANGRLSLDGRRIARREAGRRSRAR
jgi:predicted transcriptional regulator